MAVRHKTLYLFLALACFVGIILIFVFDGYIGVYDTLTMDTGQFQQKIEADQWQTERFGYLASVGVERGGVIEFNYTVENHRFSAYEADVSVSLWFGQEKLSDLTSGQVTAGAFTNGEVTWTLDTAGLVPEDYPEDQSYNINMIINRDNVERKITIFISPSAFPKPVPVPSR